MPTAQTQHTPLYFDNIRKSRIRTHPQQH